MLPLRAARAACALAVDALRCACRWPESMPECSRDEEDMPPPEGGEVPRAGEHADGESKGDALYVCVRLAKRERLRCGDKCRSTKLVSSSRHSGVGGRRVAELVPAVPPKRGLLSESCCVWLPGPHCMGMEL